MQRVKTNIKFYKGLNNVEDKIYGFVTKKNGSWKGCRSDEPKKKIVFMDPKVKTDIIPNVLYSCSIWPMKNGKGFIAKSANVVKFMPEIHIRQTEDHDTVVVEFGNKSMVYDPLSTDPKKTDIQAIANRLRKRVDLKNSAETVEEFINHACMVKRFCGM